ncbi:amidohydrolase family protein [Acetobacteraceae bacterium H6797]|nr:amidohydrolase family protein [Acetobacteraceae bacterium H6797]
MTLDAHQHFWRLERGDYGWLGPHLGPLWRDFMPEDLRPLLARTGVSRTVLVQAAPTEAETDFLLDIAARTDFVAGVVGWLDLDSVGFPDRLAHYAAQPKLVALRPMVHDLDDDHWLLRPRVLRHMELVAEAGLRFDLLLRPRHLLVAAEALRRVPSLKAVVDHCAKPDIALGRFDPWRADIAAIARQPGVYCKLSGLVTEASHHDWALEDLRPCIEHVLGLFGPERLIFGSDWPVCTLAASYGEVCNSIRALLAPYCGPQEMAGVFGCNGARFYGLEGP